MIKDIYYLSLFKVEYLLIDNELILDLNPSILVNRRDVIH
jgi:hypothetical protein